MSREKQIEEMIKAIEKCSCVYTPCEQECAQCSNEELYDEIINHIARTVYEAGYRKQAWISVEEKLPQPQKLVLCIWERGDDRNNYGFARYQMNGVWYVSNEGIPRVTHWMPLPEPPKGE